MTDKAAGLIQAVTDKRNARRAPRPAVYRATPDTKTEPLTESAHRYVMGLTIWDGRNGDPNCELCHGAGHYRLDQIPTDHPRFGKMFACECREAAMQLERADMLADVAKLSAADLALTWSDIKPTPFNRGGIAMVQEITLRGWGWVYLHGPNGPGKTHILKVAVAEAVRAGRGATFVTYADMLNHLRAGFGADDYDARLEAWRNADILAVDEFARANETNWAREAQLLVFNNRYDRAIGAAKGVTLFSSNFPPAELEPWMTSRINDSRFRVVAVDGPDLRPLMGRG